MDDLEAAFDDNDDDEMQEDWTDTSWAQPTLHQHGGGPTTKSHTQTCNQQTEQLKEDIPADGHEEDPSVVKRMLLNDNKAGMEGLDKEKINQVIHAASKGSRFYENERKKEEEMKKRIEEQKRKIDLISETQLKQGLVEADRLLEDFEQQRDLTKTIVHIDMDAFYAAVEMRDNPSLKDKPMAVGGTSMLSTSNYHARKFGVRAAMPGFIGKKLCPDLVIVSANFDKYTEVSKQVKSLISEYDPNFCPMSLDEAYLDITEHLIGRKDLSEEERTYICRDKNYVDSDKHCLCDLNDVYRQAGDAVFHTGDDTIGTKDVIVGTGDNTLDKNDSDVDTKDKSLKTRETTLDTEGDTVLSVERFFREEKSKPGSIDESWRPLCPCCRRQFPPFNHVTFGLDDEETVQELRTRIEQRTRLTASAGIAPNMMLSKVCSDKNKPNGQYKIPPTREAVMDFISDLPTRKISGIGKVSEAMLNAVGVYTCTHLYNKRSLLYHLYSQISFNYFMRICLGIGSTTVERDSERKSISTERTFQEVSKPADLFKKCEELTEALVEDLKQEQLKGKTVSIKIKTVHFEVKTRAHSLPNYTNDQGVILKTATDLLKTEIQTCAPKPLRLRLMGIRMSNLANQSICKEEKKQGTILGAFRKLAEKPKQADSPTVHGVHREPEESKKTDSRDDDQCGARNTDFVHYVQGSVQHEDKITRTSFEPVSSLIKSELVFSQVNNNSNPLAVTNMGTSRFDETSKRLHNIEEHQLNKMKQEEVSPATGISDRPCVNLTGMSGTNSTVSTGEQVNKSDNELHSNVNDSNVTFHSPRLATEGRRNRSGLVRSSKKPARKRRASKPGKVYSCPICSREISCSSLNEFNEHVDECLEGNSAVSKSKDTDSEIKSEVLINEVCNGMTCQKKISKSEAVLNVDDRLTLKNVAYKETGCVSDASLNSDRNSEDCDNTTNPCSVKTDRVTLELQTGKSFDCNTVLDRSTVSQHCDKVDNLNPALLCNNQTPDTADCVNNNGNLSIAAYGNSLPNNLSTAAYGNVQSNDKNSIIQYKNRNEDIDACKDTKRQSEHLLTESDGNACSKTLPSENDGGNPDSESLSRTVDNTTCDRSLCDNQEKDAVNEPLSELNLEEDGALDTPPLPLLPEHLDINTDTFKHTERVLSESNSGDGIDLAEDLSDNNSVIKADKHQTDNVIVNKHESKSSNWTCCDQDQQPSELDNAFTKGLFSESKALPQNNCEPVASCSWMRDKLFNATDVASTIADNMVEPLNIPDISTDIADNNEPLNVDDVSTCTTTTDNDDEPYDVPVDNVATTTPDDNNGGLLVCPVCNVEQRSADLNEFNSHVDACLSRGAITEILKEQRQTSVNGKTSKRERETTKTPSSGQPSKKRKTVMPNKSPACKSILSFFKESQSI